MSETTIHAIDLKFLGIPGAIAVYLIQHRRGGILVECGPASTLPMLQAGIQTHGLTIKDISDVFLTHIHLDHAGAAGWLARQGANIHVHPNGAAHLLNPEKLLESATRIYGDRMQSLWGEFLPVPAERLEVIRDGETVTVNGLAFNALDTPGHANHHLAYLFEQVCFTGDIGGVRLDGRRTLRLPMPPPDLHLEKWRQSLARLRQMDFRRIAPTHFGIYDDPDWHLEAIARALDEVETWMEATLPADPPLELFRQQYKDWLEKLSGREGLDMSQAAMQEAANPSVMSADGIYRYWHKYRSA